MKDEALNIQQEWGVVLSVDPSHKLYEIAVVQEWYNYKAGVLKVLSRDLRVGANANLRLGDSVKVSIQNGKVMELRRTNECLRDVTVSNNGKVIINSFVDFSEGKVDYWDDHRESYRVLTCPDFGYVAIRTSEILRALKNKHPRQKENRPPIYRVGFVRCQMKLRASDGSSEGQVGWRHYTDLPVVPVSDSYDRQECSNVPVLLRIVHLRRTADSAEYLAVLDLRDKFVNKDSQMRTVPHFAVIPHRPLVCATHEDVYFEPNIPNLLLMQVPARISCFDPSSRIPSAVQVTGPPRHVHTDNDMFFEENGIVKIRTRVVVNSKRLPHCAFCRTTNLEVVDIDGLMGDVKEGDQLAVIARCSIFIGDPCFVVEATALDVKYLPKNLNEIGATFNAPQSSVVTSNELDEDQSSSVELLSESHFSTVICEESDLKSATASIDNETARTDTTLMDDNNDEDEDYLADYYGSFHGDWTSLNFAAEQWAIKLGRPLNEEELEWSRFIAEAIQKLNVTGKDWVLDKSQQDFIVEACNVHRCYALRIIDLFELGNEVAYVARYREADHGGMSCEQVRRAYEKYVETKLLNERAKRAMVTITSTLNNNDDREHVIAMIQMAESFSDLLEIVKLYSTGDKKTKATIAREFGLEPVARQIMSGSEVELRKYINKDMRTLKEVEGYLKILIADLLNKSEKALRIFQFLSKCYWGSGCLTVTTSLTERAKQLRDQKDKTILSKLCHYRRYIHFKKDIDRMLLYEVLALERASEEKVLEWHIEVNENWAQTQFIGNAYEVASKHRELFQEAMFYFILKLYIPKVQRIAKSSLFKQGENASIDVFKKNAAQLLAFTALKNKFVVALDPGSVCKAAFLDPSGKPLETGHFGYDEDGYFDRKGIKTLHRWAKIAESSMNRNEPLVFAIGNGSGSYEAQAAVSMLIEDKRLERIECVFCVVNECGASKYSITELAEKDLPEIPATEKSAVSIGRRLIDPMAEYVKIEPKNLGLGMYQHSVDETKLSNAMSNVVSDSVSMRGVDVNTASEHLLMQVCGLNKDIAANIVQYREETGRIVSRQELKKIKGIDDAKFTQCGGFLVVEKPDYQEQQKKNANIDRSLVWHPLDATVVHPDCYEIATRILNNAGITEFTRENMDHNTLKKKFQLQRFDDEQKAVAKLLTTPPYKLPAPPFQTRVTRMRELYPGIIVDGTIVSRTLFGVFIDIGAENSAMANPDSVRLAFREIPPIGSVKKWEIRSICEETGKISVVPVKSPTMVRPRFTFHQKRMDRYSDDYW